MMQCTPGSRETRVRRKKAGIQDTGLTKTQAQMMRMHAAPYFYVFPVNNAFPACTHGLRRRLAPSDQPESCLIQEPDVRILWQDSRMKEWVETAGRVQKVLDVCQAEEVVIWNEKGNVQMGG